MKYLLFFTFVLLGVLASSTEGCNPEGHSANHNKSNDSHEIEYNVTTTAKPLVAAHIIQAETIMAANKASEAVHSTGKPMIVVAETVNKTTPIVMAEMITSTLTIVTSMKPAVVSLNTTEKPTQIVQEINKTSTTAPVEKMTVVPLANSTEKPGKVASDMQEINKTSTAAPVEKLTVVPLANSTEKPVKVASEMMATTAAIMQTSTHMIEEININKTTAAVMQTSMPMIVTSPTVIRRERRQANATMKTPTATNSPVFGSRFPTRVPMPVTHRARQGMTTVPASAGSRTTTKPKMVNKQPVGLSSTVPSRVRVPVTMKRQPVTTGPVPVRG